jgi:hypothetical protein
VLLCSLKAQSAKTHDFCPMLLPRINALRQADMLPALIGWARIAKHHVHPHPIIHHHHPLGSPAHSASKATQAARPIREPTTWVELATKRQIPEELAGMVGADNSA